MSVRIGYNLMGAASGCLVDFMRQIDYGGAVSAPVAQLDRALPSGGKGRGFESRRVHH